MNRIPIFLLLFINQFTALPPLCGQPVKIQYPDAITAAIKEGNHPKVMDICKEWYQSGTVSVGIHNWNYNALMSLEPDALLIVQNDMEAYQLWMVQTAQFNAPFASPKPWYNRTISVWQAAAALALVLAVALLFSAAQERADHVVETQIQMDTVFVDKIVWKDRVVVRKVFVIQPAATLPVASIYPDTSNEEVNPAPVVSGSSIGEQPELLQFFTRVGER